MLKRPSSLTWIEWMRAAGRRVRGTKALELEEAGEGADALHDAQLDRLRSNADGTPLVVRKRSMSGGLETPPPQGSVATSAAERADALDLVVGGEGEGFGSSDVLPLHLLDVADVEYMALLYSLLRSKPLVICYYLESLVFPEVTAHQPMKLIM